MKFIKQNNVNDCGIACISMILSYYGSRISINKLQRQMNIDNEGISAYELVKCLKKFCFDVKSIQTNENYFRSIEFKNKPIIAHVILDDYLHHYIIIEKYINNKLYIIDPSTGKKTITLSEFNSIWNGILFIPTPNKQYKKIKEKQYGLWECVPLLFSHKKYFVFIILNSILATMLSIIGTYYFQFLLDNILPNKNLKVLYSLSFIMIFIYCLQIFFNI